MTDSTRNDKPMDPRELVTMLGAAQAPIIYAEQPVGQQQQTNYQWAQPGNVGPLS